MRWQVSSEDTGLRLDRYLALYYEQPRNQVARWIREGLVQLNGRSAKAASLVEADDWIECEPRLPDSASELVAEDLPLDILKSDADFAVLNKPAGLVVHPGAGRETGTLAQRLLHHFPETATVGGPGRPGIVHRLDRDTTGALVIARTARGYRALSTAFAERNVQKSYLAIVHGVPRSGRGTFDDPIARHPKHRKQMTVASHGRRAVTHYAVRSAATGAALLEIDLETGRTHQIRVHLKHARHPLIGDPVYGAARWRELPRERQAAVRNFSRPALHAWRVAFPDPDSGELVEVVAPPAEDLSTLWAEVSDEALSSVLESPSRS